PRRNSLRIDAARVGSWGNCLAVRLLANAGGRIILCAAAGNQVETATTADASAGDTALTVPAVVGSLGATTPRGFGVRINGRQRVVVTGVAAAGAGVSLTLGTPLSADVPSGSSVQLLRTSVAG